MTTQLSTEEKFEELLVQLEEANACIEGMLKNISTDWYLNHFGKDESKKYTIESTGIAAKIYNRELLEKIQYYLKRSQNYFNTYLKE